MSDDSILIRRPANIPDALWRAVTDELLSYSTKSLPLGEKYGQIPWLINSSTAASEDAEESMDVFLDLSERWGVEWSPSLVGEYLRDADAFYASCVEKWGYPKPTKHIWEMTREEYERPVLNKRRIIHLSALGVHSLPADNNLLEYLGRWRGAVVEKVAEIPDVGTFYNPMQEVVYRTPVGERRWAYVVRFSNGESFEEEYVVSDEPLDPHSAADLIEGWNAAIRHAWPVCKLPVHYDSVLLARRIAGGDLEPHISSNPPKDRQGKTYTLQQVISHLKKTDGTGDPEWMEYIIRMASPYPVWELHYLDPSEVKNYCSDQETTEEYAEVIDQLPPAVAIPSLGSETFELIDGGHRFCAAALAGCTFPCYIPTGTRRFWRASRRIND